MLQVRKWNSVQRKNCGRGECSELNYVVSASHRKREREGRWAGGRNRWHRGESQMSSESHIFAQRRCQKY